MGNDADYILMNLYAEYLWCRQYSGASLCWIFVVPKIGNDVDIKQRYAGILVYQ